MHSKSTGLLFRQDPKFQVSVLLVPSKVKKKNPGPFSLNIFPLAPRSEVFSSLLGQKCYFNPERTDVSYFTQRGHHRALTKGWKAEEGVSNDPS